MIKIRPATLEDIPFITFCLIELWAEHALHEPDLLEVEVMKVADIEGHFVFIAEEKDMPVGFVRGDTDELYVVPSFRRRGVSKMLRQKTEETAKRLGLRRLPGRVRAYDIQTQKLLATLGYHNS